MTKVRLSPLTATSRRDLRREAENVVNGYFNTEAMLNVHRDHEHAAKRSLAVSLLKAGAGEDLALSPDHPLAQEAAMLGTSILDLAATIAGKPDDILNRGLRRREAILAIRAARSLSEIEQILAAFRPEPR